ncbi:hypothetical protein B0I35DRAFT_255921 [Stachybotrys elegans]|uniref:Uncharacterized protein n=1 Tax=Stachybotrys elegans TaxID=80388 RepID=A0A8K0ST36_9HYPO|nr:hypothetical protein B0I35DRAFT_255921 [Stachybotrys elegans]
MLPCFHASMSSRHATAPIHCLPASHPRPSPALLEPPSRNSAYTKLRLHVRIGYHRRITPARYHSRIPARLQIKALSSLPLYSRTLVCGFAFSPSITRPPILPSLWRKSSTSTASS